MADTAQTSTNQFSTATAQLLPVLKGTLRFSRPEDVDRIVAYYGDNQHTHVHIRKDEIWRDYASRGRFLLLEMEDGTLGAASAAYDYRVGGDTEGDLPSYQEIGSTRCTLPGFGLYPLIISSQVTHGSITDGPADKYIANVYNDSPVGNLLTGQCGWRVFDVTPDIETVFRGTKSAAHTNITPMTWYESPACRVPFQARVVRDFLAAAEGDTLVVTNKKTGQTLQIDLSQFALHTTLRPAMLDLAQGQWGHRWEGDTANEGGGIRVVQQEARARGITRGLAADSV